MIRTKEDLKAAFSAGKNPTEQDYKNLIDSLYGSVSHIKTSFDDIDWERDEFLVTAKAIYNEFNDVFDLVSILNKRVEHAEDSILNLSNRIKNYVDVDWDSGDDIPTADAVTQKIQEHAEDSILNLSNRIKNYVDVDWDSGDDIPTADAVIQKIQEHINEYPFTILKV